MNLSIYNKLQKVSKTFIAFLMAALLSMTMAPSFAMADEILIPGDSLFESYDLESIEEVPAPCSADDLAAGVYSVTANMGMRTPMKIYAYCTNPLNPWALGPDGSVDSNYSGIPANPITEHNAKLVVKTDGSKELTLEVPNPCFTVQNLGDPANATITGTTRIPLIAPPTNPGQLDIFKGFGYTDRINQITISLKDNSGSYEFTNCTAFATPLAQSDPDLAVINNPITLTVDFKNATPDVVNVAFEKAFVDEATGLQVSVKADATSTSIEALQGSELVVEATTDTLSDSVFAGDYSQVPEYTHYNFKLVNAGNEVVVDKAVEIIVTLPVKDVANHSVYLYDGRNLSAETVTPSGDGVVCKTKGINSFVVVNDKSATKWIRTLGGNSTGIDGLTAKYSTDLYWDGYDMGGITPEGFDEAWGGGQVVAKGVQLESEGQQAIDTLKLIGSNSGFVSPKVEGVYAVALIYIDWLDFMAFNPGAGAGHSMITATVPASENASVYYATGTGEGLTAADKLATTNDGAVAEFDVFSLDEEYDSDALIARTTGMAQAITGLDFAYSPITPQSEVAYYVVVSEGAQFVEKPAAAEGLVYNGLEQQVVADSDAYAVEGAVATDAGKYTATVTLNEGYAWADGSADPLTIEWEIAPAVLKATYAGEEITEGETPALNVEVTGFVNNETAETAAEYVAPVITNENTAVGSYELAPANGEAANYTFEYVAGTLTILEKVVPPVDPEEPEGTDPESPEGSDPDQPGTEGEDNEGTNPDKPSKPEADDESATTPETDKPGASDEADQPSAQDNKVEGEDMPQTNDFGKTVAGGVAGIAALAGAVAIYARRRMMN